MTTPNIRFGMSPNEITELIDEVAGQMTGHYNKGDYAAAAAAGAVANYLLLGTLVGKLNRVISILEEDREARIQAGQRLRHVEVPDGSH